jgi:hypothetical protein
MGEPQAPNRAPLTPEPPSPAGTVSLHSFLLLFSSGLGSPFLRHAKLFQSNPEHPFAGSRLVVFIAPVLVYLKQFLRPNCRPISEIKKKHS